MSGKPEDSEFAWLAKHFSAAWAALEGGKDVKQGLKVAQEEIRQALRGLNFELLKLGEAPSASQPERRTQQEPADEDVVKCPRCSSTMRIRKGPNGEFYGCSKYPQCKGSRPA